MLAGQRMCGWMAGLILVCTLILPACREDPDAKKSPPTAASAERSESEDSNDSAPDASAAEAAETPTIAPADAEDDAAAPTYLPATESLTGWVKHEPIRVAASANAADLLGGERAQRLRYFHFDRVARCGYACYASGELLTVDLQAIEAASADDAYGIMSVMLLGGVVESIGGEARVMTSDAGATYACWQGKVALRLVCRGDFASARDGIDRLLMQITANIHREDLPPLMEAMPIESGIPAKRRLVRHLGSLPPDALNCAKETELETITALLGLDRETLMCVASYKIPEAVQNNVVWLVQYPSAEAAAAAHDRYSRKLAGDEGGVWRTTNLMPPHGRFLIGTWTMAEESMQYVMPRIEQLLPVTPAD